MDCAFRTLKPQDFPVCLTLMRDGFAFDKALRARLPDLWRHILGSGLGEASVVEEHRSDQAVVLGFGVSAFLTDAFAAYLCAGTRPYSAVQVLEAWTGGESPLLNREQLRRANASDGLNLLVLSVGHDTTLPPGGPTYHAMARTMIQAFFAAHAGYQLKQILTETYGSVLRDDHLAGGFRLQADFADCFARHSEAAPPTDHHPYLMSLTRAEALAHPGAGFSVLFRYALPRFGFTPAERRMLRCASAGTTDEEIAGALLLSRSTVKKRWDSIYDRVEQRAAAVLSPSVPPDASGKRGAERRRRLLSYLRDHPEELRP